MKKQIIGVFVTFFLSIANADASSLSFTSAKKRLIAVYEDNPKSFYCGCDYKPAGKRLGKQIPDWASCNYSPRKQPQRASRIEWEHIMPAHHFGQHLTCWREGGRNACKKDPVFKAMEGDMHNLVPAVGELPVKAFSRHYLAAL